MGLISRVSSRTYRFFRVTMTETASINEWTLDECNDRLVDYRQKRIRDSEIVNNIAKRIFTLNSNWSKIRDKHAALEQCCMASIDCGDGGFAGRIFKLIEHDFPRDSSRRSERSYLMFFENTQIDDVISNRDDIIEKHPTDQIVLKRDITTLMDHGDIEGAIKELCRHLETYQCDDILGLVLQICTSTKGSMRKHRFVWKSW